MEKKPTLTIFILGAFLSAVIFVANEAFWSLITDAIFDWSFHKLGIEKPQFIAWVSPYIIPVIVGLAIVWVAYLVGVRERKARSPLEIQFEESDDDFVEKTSRLHGSSSQYYVGIKNRSENTVRNVEVDWSRTHFTKFIDNQLGGRETLQEPIDIHPGARIRVNLFGVDDHKEKEEHPHDILRRKCRFVIRARGENAREVSAEFEYDPCDYPKFRMIK